jgi:ABC-type lipoprotein export system ATPase subunit
MFSLFNHSNGKNGHNATSKSPWLIELRKVVKNYETPAGSFTALRGIDLQVDRGEFVAVIGKSGSGKSTLINMITGIDRPSTGEVWIGGTPVHTMKESQMAAWRGRNIGVIFQFFQLLPTLTLLENVMLPMDFCSTYPAGERPDRAMRLLEMVDMAGDAHKLPSEVSGGQQQRVAIARALANDPPILVADEPTGNLDSKTADSVFRLFEDLADNGKTIVMVTHDQDLAHRVMRAVVVADGEVIDQYLAKTFPVLSQEQLVRATHKVSPHRYAPGEVIIHEGSEADRFYIVAHGDVEVTIRQPGDREAVIAHMGSGQYFGEIELLHGGTSIASIRAGVEGVDVISLDHETFASLMEQSEPLRAAVDEVAEGRVEENLTSRNIQTEGANNVQPIA